VRRRLVALAVALAAAGPTRADLVDRLDTPVLRGLGQALAVSVGKSLPIPSASSGITFTFNPQTSAFERDTEMLGQIYLERAQPIGKGRLNMSVTYQYVSADTIDGQDLGSLSDTRPIRDPATGVLFVIPHLDVKLHTQEVTTSVTYGITEDLEANLTVPLLVTKFDVSGRLVQLGGTPNPVQTGTTADTDFGVGDIFLRGKYRLLRGRFGELAAGLVFRLPSGNEGDFQGTGLFEVDPRLFASTPVVTLAPHFRVQGYVNAGLDLVPQESDRGDGVWGVGGDIMLATRVTLSVAFLARESFARLVPPGSFDVPRANGTSTPVFGLDPGQPNYYNLSIGGRVNLWGDTIFGMWNVIVPVNKSGIRSDVVPLIGIEAAF
jgi:hypothetical protein